MPHKSSKQYLWQNMKMVDYIVCDFMLVHFDIVIRFEMFIDGKFEISVCMALMKFLFGSEFEKWKWEKGWIGWKCHVGGFLKRIFGGKIFRKVVYATDYE